MFVGVFEVIFTNCTNCVLHVKVTRSTQELSATSRKKYGDATLLLFFYLDDLLTSAASSSFDSFP